MRAYSVENTTFPAYVAALGLVATDFAGQYFEYDDYNFVAGRYAKIFWRGYDLAMLWLAMLHGVNGMRTLADDYLRPTVRQVAVRGLYVVGIFFLIIGTWVIVTFQPNTMVTR